MIQEERFYRLWLTLVPGIGPYSQNLLLEHFGSAGEIFRQDFRNPEVRKLLPSARADALLRAHDEKERAKAEEIFRTCEKEQITLLLKEEMGLPADTLENPYFPTLLYARGTWRPQPLVGIIGARRCSREGKALAIRLAAEYVRKGTGIVSGLAKGIDSYAQTAAVKEGGYTVAVLGNGLDRSYPPENDPLMKKIIETGVVISEYAPSVPPSRWSFPRRNRIIAALSSEIHVVDAGRNSGTRSTVEYARKYGRKVWVHDPAEETGRVHEYNPEQGPVPGQTETENGRVQFSEVS